MHKSRKLPLLDRENITTYRGCWEDGGRVEDFKAFNAMGEYDLDDLVVVEGSHQANPDRYGFTVVKITECDPADFDYRSSQPCRWIVSPVDTETMSQIQKQEDAILRQLTRAQNEKDRKEMAEAMNAEGVNVALSIEAVTESDD